MHRHILPELFHNPAAHFFYLIGAVVHGRNQQDDNLEPDARARQVLEGVEDRLQLAAADIGVKFPAERLQVDLDGLKDREH